MAVEERLSCRNLLAGADLSAYQYRFVYLSAAKTVSLLATTGGEAFGVLYNEPAASGRSAEVVRYGRCKVEAGAAVAAGADVSSDTAGRAITALSNYAINGKAITAASSPGDIIEVELSDKGSSGVEMERRTPSNIETAAFTAAVNATWENYNIITALNLVLTTNIETSRSVRLRGVLEFINSEAVAHEAKFADGETPDNDDTVNVFTMAAAAASEYLNVDLITDASGQIKIEVDDRTKATLKFHLKSYSYVQDTATL